MENRPQRRDGGDPDAHLRPTTDRVRGTLAAAARHFEGIGDPTAAPTITTYNAFAAGLVRDHALRIGADPDATLITGAGAWQLMDGIVQTWPDEDKAYVILGRSAFQRGDRAAAALQGPPKV